MSRNQNTDEAYKVRITDMSNLGMGIARIDNKVTFVKHAVDGDEAEIKIIKELSDYNIAIIEKLEMPSENRTEPKCPVYKRCGGCVFSEITYEHEKELKKKTVENAFRKAGLPDIIIADTLSTGNEYHYRNKMQIPVARDKNGRIVAGFYANHSHEIIPCNDCMLEDKAFDGITRFVCDFADRNGWNGLRHIFLRKGNTKSGKTEIMVCLVVYSKPKNTEKFPEEIRRKFPDIASIVLNYNNDNTNVILGRKYETVYERDYIFDTLCGLEYRISAQSFYQVNHDAAELAYKTVAEKADLKPGEKLLDLFCGTGTIGMSVVNLLGENKNTVSLTGVEIIPEAVENAKKNAAENGIENAEFICGDASTFPKADYDVLTIDPPRKGCSPETVKAIAEIEPKRIVYMSCDPATLARDVKMFAEYGYSVDGDVVPIDLFPKTGHCEAVARLLRIK